MKAVSLALIAMATIGASAPIPTSPIASAHAPVTVHVALLTFNCAGFSGRLTYRLRQGQETAERTIEAKEDVPDKFEFDFDVMPGQHELWIDAVVPQTPAPDALPMCSTYQEITTIEGHERHLLAVLGMNEYLHSSCSLVGTLPVRGLQVSLVLPKGHTMADTVVGGTLGPAPEDEDYGAVVDDDAYYVEHVAAENYELRIGAAKIPIDLSKVFDVKNPYCQGLYERDITIKDLRDAFPGDFSTE